MRFRGLKTEKENGTTRFYAYAFGQWVEVSEEVFCCMSKSERKERYEVDLKRKFGVLSLEMLMDEYGDNSNNLTFSGSLIVPSAEEDFMNEIQRANENLVVSTAERMISRLEGEERDIALSVIIKGDSLRAFAKASGRSRFSVTKLYKSTCQKLRELCRKELDEDVFDA